MKLFHVDLEISNECNLRCSYCFIKHHLKNKTIKTDDLLKSIEFIRKLYKEESVDKMIIRFCGGEPFLHADLIILTIIKLMDLNIEFHVITNGTIFNKNVSKLCSLLRNNRDYLAVSFDTDDYDSERGVSPDLVKENIKLYSNIVDVAIQTVITNENIYKKRVGGYGEKYVSHTAIHEKGFKYKDKEKAKEILLANRDKKISVLFCKSENTRCLSDTIGINIDGDVYYCRYFITKETNYDYSLGNISNYDTVMSKRGNDIPNVLSNYNKLTSNGKQCIKCKNYCSLCIAEFTDNHNVDSVPICELWGE